MPRAVPSTHFPGSALRARFAPFFNKREESLADKVTKYEVKTKFSRENGKRSAEIYLTD